jgi:hypothetical protein
MPFTGERGGSFFGSREIPAEYCDFRTPVGESSRDFGTDPPRSSGDDRDMIL